jgi:hypothetical protein
VLCGQPPLPITKPFFVASDVDLLVLKGRLKLNGKGSYTCFFKLLPGAGRGSSGLLLTLAVCWGQTIEEVKQAKRVRSAGDSQDNRLIL